VLAAAGDRWRSAWELPRVTARSRSFALRATLYGGPFDFQVTRKISNGEIWGEQNIDASAGLTFTVSSDCRVPAASCQDLSAASHSGTHHSRHDETTC
jgi:hypothetical protein